MNGYQEQFCSNRECGARISIGYFTDSGLGPFCLECCATAQEIEDDSEILPTGETVGFEPTKMEWVLRATRVQGGIV